MASNSPTPEKATNASEQPFWFYFQQIYQISRRLLQKLTNASSPTEQDLASIRKLSGSLTTATAGIRSDISMFSSTLATNIQCLEGTLPNYLRWLSHTIADPASIPDPDLATTKDYLTRLLAFILDEFPAHDDREAWTAVFADLETLRGWYRRRELEQTLRDIRVQTNRKKTEQGFAVPHLGETIRELASLPTTLGLSCTPELRARLIEYEKSEVEWEKAEEERKRAEDKKRGHKEAMQVVKVLDRKCRDDELALALKHAAARESSVQAQSSETSLCDKDLTTRAWNILRRFTFMDCSTPLSASEAVDMPPPLVHTTQNGVSLDFLMKTLNSDTALEAYRNRNAIRELVDASLLTLHDEGKPTQRYTMTASTQLALRWRHVADSQEPANRTKSLCEKALIATAADLRKVCRGMKVESGHNRRALEALRHARVLVNAPKTSWLKLGWYELCASWQFVVKLVEECEANFKKG